MTDKTLSIFVAQSYKTACDHGFHDKVQPIDHYLCLIVSEMMEAVEADRRGRRAQRRMFESNIGTPQTDPEAHWKFCFEQFIKDSVEDELADALIRIFDLIGELYDTAELDFTGDTMTYESQWTFTEKAMYFVRKVAQSHGAMCQLVDCIRFVEHWSLVLGFDIQWHIEQKMRYNAMRPNKHGKKY